MGQNGTKIAPLKGKQAKAIEALISCDTVEGACKMAGISKTTMYRYMKDPYFDSELKKAKRQLVNRSVLLIHQSCGDASRALAEICRDKKAPASARVSAAKAILDTAFRAVFAEEFEERLKSIEENLNRGLK